MSVLPIHRDLPPTPSVQPDPSSTLVNIVAPSSERTASTHVGSEDGKDREKGKGHSDGDYNEKSVLDAAYVDKGLVDVEDEEGKRQVQVVLEQKSGKEMIKELGGGPYTQPRW